MIKTSTPPACSVICFYTYLLLDLCADGYLQKWSSVTLGSSQPSSQDLNEFVLVKHISILATWEAEIRRTAVQGQPE
jgi:hypothetical protein